MAILTFLVSFVGMGVGIAYMKLGLAINGFIGMSYLFSVTARFTLVKVLRDKHEADKFMTKIETAKTEKFLTESGKII